jgi:hypothetical protein
MPIIQINAAQTSSKPMRSDDWKQHHRFIRLPPMLPMILPQDNGEKGERMMVAPRSAWDEARAAHPTGADRRTMCWLVEGGMALKILSNENISNVLPRERRPRRSMSCTPQPIPLPKRSGSPRPKRAGTLPRRRKGRQRGHHESIHTGRVVGRRVVAAERRTVV